MSTTITKAEAVTRIAELMERTAQGETFEITVDGRPVVRMEPPPKPEVPVDREKAIQAAEEIIEMTRSFGKVPADQVKAMIHEGHRC